MLVIIREVMEVSHCFPQLDSPLCDDMLGTKAGYFMHHLAYCMFCVQSGRSPTEL